MILGSALYSFYFVYEKYKDKQVTEQIIDEIFNNEIDSNNEEQQVEETPIEETLKKQADIVLTNNYLGYIELSNYGIKRLITTGTDKATLDKGLVGTLKTSANLDDEVGNVILAGHSTSNVFQNLHYTKIGDQIKIVTHQKTYLYVITERHTISDNDMSYFKKVTNKKILTLVTCKSNNKQRLIVVAELRG